MQRETIIFSREVLGLETTVDWVLWVYIHEILSEADFMYGVENNLTPYEVWILKSLKKGGHNA